MLLLLCAILLYMAGVQAYCPCHPDSRSNHNRFCNADFVILAKIDGKELKEGQLEYHISIVKSGGCIDGEMPEFFFNRQRNPPYGNAHGNPHSGSPPHGNPNPGKPPKGNSKSGKQPEIGSNRQKRSPKMKMEKVSIPDIPRSSKGVGNAKHIGKSDTKPVKNHEESKPKSYIPGDEITVNKTKIYTSAKDDPCHVDLLTGTKYFLSGSIIPKTGEMIIDQCNSIVIECKKKNKLTPYQESKLISKYNTSCEQGCREMTFQYMTDITVAEADASLAMFCKAVYNKYECYDQGSSCDYNPDENKCAFSPEIPEYIDPDCGWHSDLSPYN